MKIISIDYCFIIINLFDFACNLTRFEESIIGIVILSDSTDMTNSTKG